MSDFQVAPRRPGGYGSDRGRPRDQAMDGAILLAAIQLLAEVGYSRVTVAEVARRAGVSKPAIYRRWAQKSQLVVEAMVTQMPTRVPPDTGSTSGDLLALTQQLIATLTKTPLGRVLPGLVAEMAADPVLAASYRGLIIEPTRMLWRAAVEAGIARGDLAAGTDVEFVLDALAGPLYVRILITGDPIEPDYARAGVDLVLARYGTNNRPTA
jgi:AcrR family transcriptional regulator